MDSSFWQYRDYAYIRGGSERDRQTTAGWSKTSIFGAFGRYVFGMLRDKAKLLDNMLYTVSQ